MANIVLIGQWVNAMESAVFQLERAINNKDKEETNRLRTLIFDLYTKIDLAMKGEKNV